MKDISRELYERMQKGEEISAKVLNKSGLNSRDLTLLVQNGTLVRIQRGIYTLGLVEFFKRGEELLKEKKYYDAAIIYEKCLTLNPLHKDTYLKLILTNIKRKDYKRVFELLERHDEFEDALPREDYNVCLYLLNYVTNVPLELRDYVLNLEFKDLKVQTERDDWDKGLQNIARGFLCAYQLKKAATLYHKSRQVNIQPSALYCILDELLSNAIQEEIKIIEHEILLINDKEYEKLRTFLLSRHVKKCLSRTGELLLTLCETLLEIKNTNTIPTVLPIANKNRLISYIEAHDYKRALEFNNEYNKKNNIEEGESPLALLLRDICRLIDELSKNREEDAKERVSVSLEDRIDIPTIYTLLMNGEVEKGLVCIRQYLESIDKGYYYFLIEGLIKIRFLEKNGTFSEVFATLSLVKDDNFTPEIPKYLKRFYGSLAYSKFEIARIYLEIISKTNELGQCKIDEQSLYRILETASKVVGLKEENRKLLLSKSVQAPNKVATSSVEPTAPHNHQEPSDTPKEDRKINKGKQTRAVKATNPIQLSTLPKEEVKIGVDDGFHNLVDRIHKELVREGGIILLEPMSLGSTKEIRSTAKKYRDIKVHTIGLGETQRLFLRYMKHERMDVSSIIREGKEAYWQRDYDFCIECFLQVLSVFTEPKAYIYSMLGLAYLKSSNIEKAITYLTVATEVSKKEDRSFDYTDLIAKLKGENNRKEEKPYFEMQLEEFNNSDVQTLYGIENFDLINDHIVCTGIDVETACKHFGLTGEQTDIVKLLYAREFFIRGYIEKGDEFLLSVDKSKNKTSIVIDLLYEMRKNRLFYSHRENVQPKVELPSFILKAKDKRRNQNP